MGRNLSQSDLEAHKNHALQQLDLYISALISNSDGKIRSKADKLSYWIEDWSTFLNFESSFSPKNLRRYKRGEVIKVHLGYNVGSEEGGLHYCVVLDKENSRNSPVITIVPLTSVKQTKDITHLHPGNVYLGNEIFTSLNAKISLVDKTLKARIMGLKNEIEVLKVSLTQERYEKVRKELDIAERENVLLTNLRKEVFKMKNGSIALVSQIRTISKIRIYDPKTNWDILSNVKLSNEKLDSIDATIMHNFTNNKQ